MKFTNITYTYFGKSSYVVSAWSLSMYVVQLVNQNIVANLNKKKIILNILSIFLELCDSEYPEMSSASLLKSHFQNPLHILSSLSSCIIERTCQQYHPQYNAYLRDYGHVEDLSFPPIVFDITDNYGSQDGAGWDLCFISWG